MKAPIKYKHNAIEHRIETREECVVCVRWWRRNCSSFHVLSSVWDFKGLSSFLSVCFLCKITPSSGIAIFTFAQFGCCHCLPCALFSLFALSEMLECKQWTSTAVAQSQLNNGNLMWRVCERHKEQRKIPTLLYYTYLYEVLCSLKTKTSKKNAHTIFFANISYVQKDSAQRIRFDVNLVRPALLHRTSQ